MEGKGVKIIFSSHYVRAAKKVPRTIFLIINHKVAIFQNDPFHLFLHTHKLVGKLLGHHAFSVTRDYRIIFRFVDTTTVLFESIGRHDEVY